MICKKLRKSIFIHNNILVLRLPDLNPRALYNLLKKKGFQKEAEALYAENISGNDFISILSNYHGIPILFEDFHLSEDSVEKLKLLYLDFYRYRRKTLKNLLEKERPFYYF